MNLYGEVYNDSSGVIVRINDSNNIIDNFINAIKNEAPKISRIVKIETINCERKSPYTEFSITTSQINNGDTQVSPDISICPDCLNEYQENSRRHKYPFINCTYCGPRFSIIQGLPYDRPNTTMAKFEMCDDCKNEYRNFKDRRFHAQPIACDKCGPHYNYIGPLIDKDVVRNLIYHLENGEIVMLKGIGGYNLICNADSTNTVKLLREIKCRPRKPFAVMIGDMDEIKKITIINKKEEEILESWRKPIVTLRQKKEDTFKLVAPFYKTLGVMMPYMAIHYDIFKNSNLRALVVTSANRNGYPMLINDEEAYIYAQEHGFPVISYNREIYNRIDDSVVSVADDKVLVLRRGRGYAPEPIFTSTDCDGILAMGAEIVPHFAIGIKNAIISSQYIGSLENMANEEFYKDSLNHFFNMFHFTPRLIAVDAHPDYVSTKIGKSMWKDTPIVPIWHHHAHAVAVMAEHNINEPVLALCLDGAGLGCDKTIWGGELLKCTRSDFERLDNLPLIPMPGGDMASIEGWRMVISLFYKVYGSTKNLPISFKQRIGEHKISNIEELIIKEVNTPYTSSAGRVFDAIASLLNVSDVNTYESESPILLEQISDSNITESYDVINGYRSILDGILEDLGKKEKISIISARFHNSFVLLLFNKIMDSVINTGLNKIVLSGGVFQNKLITRLLINKLMRLNIMCYISELMPCNDANIAIGQIIIARSKQKE